MLLAEAAIHDGYRSSCPRQWINTSGGWECAISIRACLYIGSTQHIPFFKDHCRILDLAPLLTSPTSPPAVISKSTASRRQPILNIAFASDRNSLIISTEDRRVIRLFHVRPVPSVFRWAVRGELDSGHVVAETWRVYNLQQGCTSAEDGWWTAGTRKRTIHVFAVNPFGGKPYTWIQATSLVIYWFPWRLSS